MITNTWKFLWLWLCSVSRSWWWLRKSLLVLIFTVVNSENVKFYGRLIKQIIMEMGTTSRCVQRCMRVCSFAAVVSDSLRPHWLEPARFLCPWYSPGKNIRVCCHALLQGIFPTQGSNPNLLHLLLYRQILYPLGPLSPLVSPCTKLVDIKAVKPTKGPGGPFDERNEKEAFVESKNYIFLLRQESVIRPPPCSFTLKRKRRFAMNGGRSPVLEDVQAKDENSCSELIVVVIAENKMFH